MQFKSTIFSNVLFSFLLLLCLRICFAEKVNPLDSIDIDYYAISQRINFYTKKKSQCASEGQNCCSLHVIHSFLSYNHSKIKYAKDRLEYSDKMNKWKNYPIGTEPINPAIKFNTALDLNRKIRHQFPNCKQLDKIFFLAAHMFCMVGELDSALMMQDKLLQQFPNSRFCSYANFTLGNLRQNEATGVCAGVQEDRKLLKQINSISMENTFEEKLYIDIAQKYFEMNYFEKSIKLLHTYLCNFKRDNCQLNKYYSLALSKLVDVFTGIKKPFRSLSQDFSEVLKAKYSEDFLYLLGFSLYNEGELLEANKILKAALDKNPKNEYAKKAKEIVKNMTK